MFVVAAGLFQIVVLCLFIPLISKTGISFRVLCLLILGATGILYPFYFLIGPLAMLISLVYVIAVLYAVTRDWTVSIVSPAISLILNVLGSYLAELAGMRLFGLVELGGDHWSASQIFILLGGAAISFMLLSGGKFLFQRIRGLTALLKRYGLLLAAISLLTVLIFYTNIWFGRERGYTRENIQANSILFLGFVFLLLMVGIILVRVVMRETEMQNKQLQMEQLTAYTENLEHLYQDMQKFRHDYVNILLTMSEHIRSRDMERLEAYFHTRIMPISRSMENNAYRLGALKQVHVQELKGILASKLIQAQESGIETVFEAVEPVTELEMDIIDLCRCVGILLDNAIEECLQCERKVMSVGIIQRESTVLIVIQNGCRPDTPAIFKLFEKGFSTKGGNRGIGLSSLREIVDRSAGVSLDTRCENGEFIQELRIDKEARGFRSQIIGL